MKVLENPGQAISEPEPHPQGDGEDNTSVETIELLESDGNTNIIANDLTPSDLTPSDRPWNTSSEPLASSGTLEKTATSPAPTVVTDGAPTEPQASSDEGLSTPPLDTTSDSDRLVSAPSTPVKVPAEIAVVSASPSKRVVFSPNKQESRLSTPTVLPVVNLRGILKSPTKQPPQANVPGQSSGNVSVGESTSQDAGDVPMNIGSTQDGSLLAGAMDSLEFSSVVQDRISTYTLLQTHFRTFNDAEPYLDEVRATIRLFAAYLLRDLDPSNPPTLMQAALKCTGYYFFNQSIVILFTAKEIESLLTLILRLVSTTDEKATCNLALWCLASARIPQKMLTPFVPGLVKAFAENVDSRFKSLSITNESLLGLFSLFSQFPAEPVLHVQSWFIPVVMKLVSNIPGIRSKALEIVTMATPKLIEKGDHRRVLVIQSFMKDHSVEFFGLLTRSFLENGDEVYAITVWGAIVTLIGKPLQKYSGLNSLLKMAEKCFNSTSLRRNEIKMAAYQAWSRLIYNFAIGGHIASEKPMKLMLTPIKNGFIAERHKRVRLACANAWVSLVYAMGSKLSENAEQVLFEQLRIAVVDPSEHIRELALRLMVALFSNIGGQDLIEGRQNIVPGTISFTDLGLTEAAWVRKALLYEGLNCLQSTMEYHPDLVDVNFEEWHTSSLTGLPLLTRRCARAWEAIVRAIQDINGQEKEMRATKEAGLAMSGLLLFIEKTSLFNPKDITPKDWPGTKHKGLVTLQQDMELAGYIYRADTVHYLYSSLIESFSSKTLASHRYQIRDWVHTGVRSATDVEEQMNGQDGELLTPIDSILKTWLVIGGSVLGTAFETSFWQAVATLVDTSKSGIHVFQALYRAIHHMEDIKSRRKLHTNTGEVPRRLSPLVFRDFQCKYWSIIAQRLGVTIHSTNELADNMNKSDDHRYKDLFKLMSYPFTILKDPDESTPQPSNTGLDQRSQETESTSEETEFMEKFRVICMPTWRDLLQNVYKVIQHKYSNANAAMNILASYIQKHYYPQVPFVWIQSLSIACASLVVETLVVVGPKTSLPQRSQSRTENLGHLLNLCAFLFSKAYEALGTARVNCDDDEIPTIHEQAFLLMEKIINKAPPVLAMDWLHQLQQPIIQWMDDPLGHIRTLPKASRRVYQARIETLWCDCVLVKLMSCPVGNNGEGSKSGFGSVLASRPSTIRNAVHQAAISEDTSTSTSSSALQGGRDSGKGMNPYTSKTLVFLSPLLFVGLNSWRKTTVNKTLEFWNKTFGSSSTELEYPKDLVSIFKQLKLVATISLPGWAYEDSSQTEVPQFASLSQEMLSIPPELNVRSGLSRMLKRKAEAAGQDVSKKAKKSQSKQGSGKAAIMTGGSSNVSTCSTDHRASTPDDVSSSDSDSSDVLDDRSKISRAVEQLHAPEPAKTPPVFPKENRKVAIKVEPPSSPSLRPYQAIDDISALDGLGDNDEVTNCSGQLLASKNIPTKVKAGPVKEHSDVQMEDSSMSSHNNAESVAKGASQMGDESAALVMTQDMEVETEPATTSRTPQCVSVSVTTGEHFVQVVRQLVEDRVAIGQLDMRQLNELQSQLVTLNQAVCEAWRELTRGEERGA